MRCCIFGAGDYDGRGVGGMSLHGIVENSLVIAADAGYEHVVRYAVRADILLGDFDSLGDGAISGKNIRVIRHPVEKDDTDTALAAEEGIRAGCDEFFIFGGTGGNRPDHTVANIQVLVSLAERGAAAYLIGNTGIFTVIKDSRLVFDPACSGGISVFSLSPRSEHTVVKGLYYSADDVTLTNDRALGVSNRFISASADISVGSGTLLVFWSNTVNPLPLRIAP